MARTVPWSFPDDAVYHNDTECAAGGGRLTSGFQEGTRGKRLCPECMTRNALAQGNERLPQIPAARRSL